jgi:hypothetical protein
MRIFFVILVVAFVFLVISMAFAQGDGEVFLTTEKAISGISIGILVLLITTAISIGRKSAIYDRHIDDREIHVPLSSMAKMFVDKVDCKEKTRLLRETHDAIIQIQTKLDHIIDKEK